MPKNLDSKVLLAGLGSRISQIFSIYSTYMDVAMKAMAAFEGRFK